VLLSPQLHHRLCICRCPGRQGTGRARTREAGLASAA
jgi:hypothetical protein